MIFLQTKYNTKQIDICSEIIPRPDCHRSFEKGDHQLTEKLRNYRSKDEVHFGLSGCNQPYSLQCIVRTESGAEKNVGISVARKSLALPVTWPDMTGALRRAGLRHRKAYPSRQPFACRTLSAGTNPNDVASQMDHSAAQEV